MCKLDLAAKSGWHICTIFVPYLYLIETTRHRKYTQQLRCSVPVCTLHTHLFWIRVSCKLHNSWLLLWQDCDMIRLLMTRGGSLCDLRTYRTSGSSCVCKSHKRSDTAAVQKQDQPKSRRLGRQCKALKSLLLTQEHEANVHGKSSKKVHGDL